MAEAGPLRVELSAGHDRSREQRVRMRWEPLKDPRRSNPSYPKWRGAVRGSRGSRACRQREARCCGCLQPLRKKRTSAGRTVESGCKRQGSAIQGGAIQGGAIQGATPRRGGYRRRRRDARVQCVPGDGCGLGSDGFARGVAQTAARRRRRRRQGWRLWYRCHECTELGRNAGSRATASL